MSLFLVEHRPIDRDAWMKFFQESLETKYKNRDTMDIFNDSMFEGNLVLLSMTSVNMDLTLCIWRAPSGTTVEAMQDLLDRFTQKLAKNSIYAIEGFMGIQNLSFEQYIRDTKQLAETGSVMGPAYPGDMYFVHHNIKDKASWDKLFCEKMALLKGKTTTQDISEVWVNDPTGGIAAATWCGLGDNDAACFWFMPKTSSEADFQTIVDTFTGPSAAKNDIYKIDGNYAMGSGPIHPDFYTQMAIQMADSM